MPRTYERRLRLSDTLSDKPWCRRCEVPDILPRPRSGASARVVLHVKPLPVTDDALTRRCQVRATASHRRGRWHALAPVLTTTVADVEAGPPRWRGSRAVGSPRATEVPEGSTDGAGWLEVDVPVAPVYGMASRARTRHVGRQCWCEKLGYRMRRVAEQ